MFFQQSSQALFRVVGQHLKTFSFYCFFMYDMKRSYLNFSGKRCHDRFLFARKEALGVKRDSRF